MNTLQAALQRDIQRDIADRGGLDQYRDHALRHQQLKTVVRVSGQPAANTRLRQRAVQERTHPIYAHCTQLGSCVSALASQESHCTPVIQLAFNSTSSSVGNLLATVGGDQATVYDDIHMGDNVDIVVHFVNSKTEHSKGGVSSCVRADHPHPRPWHGSCSKKNIPILRCLNLNLFVPVSWL